jgi:uncharacterized protein
MGLSALPVDLSGEDDEQRHSRTRRPNGEEGLMRLKGLSRHECLSHLASAHVGRVGISLQAMPAVLPVAFKLRDESILFSVSPGSPLAQAAENSVIAFQVDDFDHLSRTGWTVMGVGVSKSAPLSTPTLAAPEPWVTGEEGGRFLELQFDLLTGHEVL